MDARPAGRFAKGHAPGAVSIPFNGLVPPPAAAFAKLLGESRRLIVYGVMPSTEYRGRKDDAELRDRLEEELHLAAGGR